MWRVIPLILSFVLLGTHFLRWGNFPAMLLSLLIPVLLLIKKRWILYVLQIFTYTGATIWLSTTIQLLHMRQASGRPWSRMVIILGIVTLFTMFSAVLLNSSMMKEKYPRSED